MNTAAPRQSIIYIEMIMYFYPDYNYVYQSKSIQNKMKITVNLSSTASLL